MATGNGAHFMIQDSPDRPARKPRLLLIEDDAGLRRSLQLLLLGCGFDVRAYRSAAHVLGAIEAVAAEILLIDYRLPDVDGFEVLRLLRARGWLGRAVMATGFPAEGLAERARAAGFDALLEKPLRRHELLAAIGGNA